MTDGKGPFEPTNGWGNAVLNFQLLPQREFSGWASAFWQAGATLFEAFQSRQGYSDLDACPIVFLYRHAVELFLKGIALEGKRWEALRAHLESRDPNPVEHPNLNRHKLSPWMPPLQQVLTLLGEDWQGAPPAPRNFAELRALVEAIDDVDEKATAFRYPVSVDAANPNLPGHFVLSVPDFVSRVHGTLEILEGIATSLACEIDTTSEQLVVREGT